MAVEVNFVDVKGTLTRYYRAGDGPAVVLVHGIGMTADTWIRNIDALAENHTVFAPDLLGCGFTEGLTAENEPPLRELSDHLLAFLEAVRVNQATLVGSSLGGWVVGLSYFARPDRVKGLVFVGCEVLIGSDAERIQQSARAPLKNGEAVFNNPTIEGMRDRIGEVVADVDTVPESVYMIQMTAAQLPWAREAFRRRMAGMCNGDLAPLLMRDRLSAITVPVLAIWGDSDPRGDRVVADSVGRLLPGRSVTFERTGHLPQLERFEEFNAEVASYLEQHQL